VVSWLSWLARFIVMLLVFPVMIGKMGTADFGLWAALTAPTNMTGLFGIGIAGAIVSIVGRLLGQARAAAESDGLREHLDLAGATARLGVLLSSATGALAALVGYAIAPWIVSLLSVPAAEEPNALFLFRASSLCLGGMLAGSGLSAVLDSVGRVDLHAVSTGFVSVCNALLLLTAVMIEPDFGSLAWVSIATALINVVAPLVMLAACGGMRFLRLGTLGPVGLRRFTRLAIGLGSVDVIGTIVDPSVKWSVAAIGGGAPVASYELAQRAVSILSGTFSALLAPLAPYYARTLTEHGSKHVTDRVTASSRLMASLGFPTIALFAASSDALMYLWLGEHVPAGAVASLEVLSLSTLISIGVRPAWGALVAAGKGRRLFAVQATSLAFMILALALAAWHLIPLTVAAAVAVAGFSLAGSAYCLLQYGRTFGRRAGFDVLRSFQHGLLLAGVATPIVVGMRLADTNPIAQVGIAAAAWLLVLAYLFRAEPQFKAVAARLHR
jgi:O-antigen/teichoic acid export membrane protein